MNIGWIVDTAFMTVLKGFLNRNGLIVTLFITCMVFYADPGMAGSGGNSNNAAGSNQGISGSSGSHGVAGSKGYPGISGD